MNYLIITNQGLICAEDLMLIGSSTKREQVGKIGMFGSGWKYALAWMLRNDCKPLIFAGNNTIDVDFEVSLHRDIPVKIITVNGAKTSLTTEMGPKWTGWMAIREVLSNAIDEGEHTITTSWLPEFKGIEGQTVVYIPMSNELSEVMLKFDSYFAFYRKESYVNEKCRMFFKTEESNLNVYRKGIRCYDTSKRTKVDFDFNEIAISEDRLTSETHINDEIKAMITKGLPTHILKRLLLEENGYWLPYSVSESLLQNLTELISEGNTFTTPTLQKLGGLLFSQPNALVIPAEWFKKLQDLGLVKSPFESIGGAEPFIKTEAKNTSGIAYHLSSLNIKAPIVSGKCESEAFFTDGTIYVKDDSAMSDIDIAAEVLYRMSRIDFKTLMH